MSTAPTAAPPSDASYDGVVQAMILIDFDNIFPPTHPLTSSSLRHGLVSSVRAAVSVAPNVTHVRVRLYGGWMTGGILSRRGSEVATLLFDADPFPLKAPSGATVYGLLELATGILEEPGMVFEDTYRRRGAVPRLRLTNSPLPKNCALDESHCPAKILTKFTKSAGKLCPAVPCPVTASDAFLAHEQKMVDTLITCDLLETLRDVRCPAVLLVSADTDFVPPMLYARLRSNIPICLVVPAGSDSDEISDMLSSRGIVVRILGQES